MKHFIETHLTVVFAVACLLGLSLPGMGAVPSESIVLILAVVTFLACFRLQWADMRAIAIAPTLAFCFVRFAALPLLLWMLIKPIAPDYASAVLLIALLPAGVSSPAFTALFGGNVALALFVTLFGTLASIAVIPLMFAVLGEVAVTPPAGKLLSSLLLCLLLPMAVYYPLRRHVALKQFSAAHGRVLSVLLIALITLLVVAKQRDTILVAPSVLVAPFFIVAFCYSVFMAAGWAMFPGRRQDRIAMLTCSSYNNAALGISLALFHFPPAVIHASVAAQLCWILLPLATRPLLAARPGRAGEPSLPPRVALQPQS